MEKNATSKIITLNNASDNTSDIILSYERGLTSPCGKEHRSNNCFLRWIDIVSPTTPIPIECSFTNQTVMSYPIGYGHIVGKCHDTMCAHVAVLIPMYFDNCPYSSLRYNMPIDWLYHAFCSFITYEQMADWLVDRLIGLSAQTQKIFFHNDFFVLWDGMVWKSQMNVSTQLSLMCVHYLNNVLSAFKKDLSCFGWTRILREKYENLIQNVIYSVEDMKNNMYNLKNFTGCCKADKYKAPADLFDGEQSKGYVILKNRYLDLRTGDFVDPNPMYYISNIIPHAWNSLSPPSNLGCESPKVIQYFKDLFAFTPQHEVEGKIKGLQLILGYALTGENTHNPLVFFLGAGGNGKSVFLNFLHNFFNDNHNIRGHKRTYGQMASFNIIDEGVPFARVFSSMDSSIATSAKRNIIVKMGDSAPNSHNTHLQCLIGKRLVIVDELSKTSRIQEDKTKQLTGGDPLSIRVAHARKEEKYYNPTHTIFISSNEIPYLSDTRAMRRRVHIIDFDTKFITQEDNDKMLNILSTLPPTSCKAALIKKQLDKCVISDPARVKLLVNDPTFKNEFLLWVIRGSIEFYKTGIILGDNIKNFAEKHWHRNNKFLNFMEENYILSPEEGEAESAAQGYVLQYELFRKDYDSYLKSTVEYPINNLWFNNALSDLDKLGLIITNDQTRHGRPERGNFIIGLKKRI